MHLKTINCVDKAESLIKAGGEDNLLYASLQLRMAIEFLFYELIPLYSDELPTDLLQKWQPQKILNALLDCDPLVNQDSQIVCYEGESNNQPFYQGSQKAVSKKLIKNHWHKLGSFLHSKMVDDERDIPKWEKFLRKTINVLRDYKIESPISYIRQSASFECICGRMLKRNTAALKINPRVTCPDDKCGAMFDYSESEDEGEMNKFIPVDQPFTCPQCATINYVGMHMLKEGFTFTCCQCKRKLCISSEWTIRVGS